MDTQYKGAWVLGVVDRSGWCSYLILVFHGFFLVGMISYCRRGWPSWVLKTSVRLHQVYTHRIYFSTNAKWILQIIIIGYRGCPSSGGRVYYRRLHYCSYTSPNTYCRIFISYARLLRIMIEVISFTTITYPDGYKKPVWLVDGNYELFTGKHIPLVLLTAVFVLLTLPYTFTTFIAPEACA